jgi:hypothetical protein
MSAINIIKAYAKKQLTKNRGSGIMELPSDMVTEARAGEIAAMLQRAGIPVEQLDQFIRSEKDLLKYLNIIEATSKPNYTVLSGKEATDQLNKLFGKKGEVVDMTGKKLDPGKPIMGGTQDDTVTGIMTQVDERMTGINKANKKLGELLREREIMYGQAPKTKDNPKVVDREMFKEANERFNKTDTVADIVTKIVSMEPVAALKEANKIIGRKGAYKNLTKEQSQKILKDTDDWIFQRDLSDRWDYNKNRPFRDDPDFDPEDPAYLQRMRDEDAPDDFAIGGRVGYATKGKVDLADLQSLQNLKKNSENKVKTGVGSLGRALQPASQRNRIKNKVITSFIYAVDNMDQEKSEYVKELFNGALQVGYETDMSGIKTDLFEKAGIVPINSETIYKTIVNLNLPKEIKAEMAAISNTAGDEELSASLKKNNMGLTWDSDSQEIKGEYTFTLGADGNTQIKPMVIKDADSQIFKEVKIDQAIGDGQLNFTLNESDIDNSKGKEINYQNDSVSLYAQNVQDDNKNWSQAGGTVEVPFYLLNKEEKPIISGEFFTDMDSDFKAKQFSAEFPLTDNLKIYGSRYEDDQGDFNETDYGIKYNKTGSIGEMGNWFFDAGIDKDQDWSANVGFSIPFGKQEKKGFNYSTNNPEEAFQLYKNTGGFKYDPNIERDGIPLQRFYAGGIADVKPDLSDIGHGSDSLMSRTRLMSPGAQATTSTGLNYLLAEDNDNIRVPFKTGTDQSKRAFMKLIAALTGGVAALKSGFLSFGGKGATKNLLSKVTTDNVKGKPEWFDALVTRVIQEGDDVTKKFATAERQTVHQKNLGDDKVVRVTQDVDEGAIRVEYESADNVFEDTVQMQYKKPLPDEGNPNPSAEFEVAESGPVGRQSGPDDFDIEVDEVGGSSIKDLSSDVSILKEYATGTKPNMKELVQNMKRKDKAKRITTDPEAQSDAVIARQGEALDYDDYASGGRIGFAAGKSLAAYLADRTIKGGSSRKFLEKVFGKQRFEEMISGDPDLHRGLLEVVEMFRSRDKEGLKMYMQKFLPHMDDAMVEEFIVGTRPDIEGIQGQLLRLGSGRDYKGKLEMIKEADNIRKLEGLDVSKMKPNAEGGRIGKWMGGGFTAGKRTLSELLKFMAKDSTHGKTPSEMLQMLNPRQFSKMLNDPAMAGKFSPDYPGGIGDLIQNYITQMKGDRVNMIGDLIGTGKRIKQADDRIASYVNDVKKRFMKELNMSEEEATKAAVKMAEMMEKQVGKKATPKITEQGLLEMENIQKNLLTKDRKLNANGGLQTMLGE